MTSFLSEGMLSWVVLPPQAVMQSEAAETARVRKKWVNFMIV